MPLFEFQCVKCGNIMEDLVKTTTTRISCKKCGGRAEKILSAPNFIVHGFNAKNLYGHTKSVKDNKDSKGSTDAS